VAKFRGKEEKLASLRRTTQEEKREGGKRWDASMNGRHSHWFKKATRIGGKKGVCRPDEPWQEKSLPLTLSGRETDSFPMGKGEPYAVKSVFGFTNKERRAELKNSKLSLGRC